MIRLIYDIGIRLYALAVRISAPFLPKAKDWVEGRTDFWSQLPPTENRRVIWFHCASLGEFDQGLPIMNELKAQFPDAFLLVTFFSPSGFNHFQKRKHTIDFACYLPIDTASNARRFVSHFQPEMAIFVKYEFWSNYVFALKRQGTKVFSVSTLMRPNHRFFKWYGGYFRATLKQFDFFYVQNTETLGLLNSIGIESAMVTGDTRFDRVIENRLAQERNTIIDQFTKDKKRVLIAGSTWPADEKLLLPTIHSGLFDAVIIAPHNIDEKHIREITTQLSIPHLRYSQLTEATAFAPATVLILDTIGHLASAYHYGQLAYVGGGFSGSLHNILEPAVFGLPVLFGPKHQRFPEAQAFIDAGIGFSVSTGSEFEHHCGIILNKLPELSRACETFVDGNKGASQNILTHLLAPIKDAQS